MVFQKQQRPFLNLNDYLHKLVRHPSDKKTFQCPACTGGKLKFSPVDGTLFKCHGSNSAGCEALDICKALTQGESTFLSDEQKARNEAFAHAEVEKQRARLEAQKPAEQKNKEFLATLSQRTLSNPHRQDMLDRGYTPEMIEASGAKSFAAGRGMPVRDYTGKVVGIQRAGKGEKFWMGGDAGNYKLKETDELPLSIVYPTKICNPKRGAAHRIGLVEGTGDKVFLAANQLEHPMIGSSNVGSQPKDLARSAKGIQVKYGWQKIEFVLYPDAGMLANKNVMGNYAKLQAQIAEMGFEMKVCWWNQYLKTDGDVDEFMLADGNNKVIEWDKFLKIGEHRKSFLELSQLELDPSKTVLASVNTVNQKYIPKIEILPGTINLIASPCGTGKTVMMLDIIKEWLIRNPNSRVIDLIHIDAIRTKHNKDLGFEDWQVGSQQNVAALNSFDCISACINSILAIDLNEIPHGSLVPIDEVEAVFKFLVTAGNMGKRAVQFQEKFVAILRHVMYGGGAIIGAQDEISDITVNGLNRLLKGKYPIHLTVNEYIPPAPSSTTLYKANKSHFAERLDALVSAKKRVFVPASSQVHLEEQCRILMKTQEGLKALMICRKTNGLHDDFLENPDEYLIKHTPDIVLGSPKMQSGVSMSVVGAFQVVMGHFSGNGVDGAFQMIHRYRVAVPMELYLSDRGVDAGQTDKSWQKFHARLKAISSEVYMAQGGAITQSAEGVVWNELYAQFKYRDMLESEHLYQYFRLKLISRGHNVIEGVSCTSPEFKERLGVVKEELIVEKSNDIANADTKGMTQAKADAIQGSAHSNWVLQCVAKKFITEQHYPGLPIIAEWVRKALLDHQGQFAKAIDFRYFCLNPKLARHIDDETIQVMRNGNHTCYFQAPTTCMKVNLMLPILADLTLLAEGGEFDNNTPEVRSIAAYAVSKSMEFSKFYRFIIKVETVSEEGKRSNSCVATVNKLLRALGYKSERTSQRREGKERIGCYSVTNADDADAKAMMSALDRRFAAYEPKVVEQEFKAGMPVVFDGQLAEVISAEECGGHGGIRTMYIVRTASGDETYQRKELLRRA